MKPVRVVDIEVYKDYFLVNVLQLQSNVAVTGHMSFEMWPGKPLDAGLRECLSVGTLITFNGNHFDLPLIALALAGADNVRLKAGCDAIIGRNLKSWQFEREFLKPKGAELLEVDTIDLIEVAPGIAGLKIYTGRLHTPKMQDLPIQPDASISPADRPVLREYCANDCRNTELLYRHLLPQLELRERMSEQYGVDLRSKSDAQIAEVVISQEVGVALGREVVRPEVPAGTTFHFKAPAYIRFLTPQLQALKALIEGLDFVVQQTGAVAMPKGLTEQVIKIGATGYQMGIGGLHSKEKSAAHVANDCLLIDRDVTSYYPSIILRNNWAPAHMGAAFTKTYGELKARRLAAKRSGDKVTSESLKIVLNGSFGKLGSKWSKLYAPHLMIHTTLAGQLSLLMLIEMLELFGIAVVSGNTDGIVIKCSLADVDTMDLIVAAWEEQTGFETEATEYAALYSRDINNYIAIKKDGGVKAKGAYTPVTLQKNPANEICGEAAARFLKSGIPVEESVYKCQDIRKFLTVRQVKGGAVKDGEYLGKAVRWYYSTQASGVINYKVNGYTVARSEGARPLMTLPESMPADVDYGWYIDEANSIIKEVGAVPAEGI